MGSGNKDRTDKAASAGKSPAALQRGADRKAERNARLASALRQNLARRKAQARGRRDEAATLADAARDTPTAARND